MRDFIPWVRSESSQPPDSKEGEEEEMTGLLNRYAAKKRKWWENVKRRFDAAPDQADGSSQPETGGSSELQMIIIPGSPETGSYDRLDIRDDALGELGEAAPTPPMLQMISHLIQVGSRSGRSEFTRTGLKRPSFPDRIVINSYLLSCGPAPPKEKV